jgi:hypothetical protein
MSLLSHSQRFVDEFFHAVELLQEGYMNSSFSYVAIKSGDTFVLIQARLFLNAKPSSAPFSHFILVVTREDFEQVINRTLILPNADRLYEEAERSIRAAQAKYELQPTFPLPEQAG